MFDLLIQGGRVLDGTGSPWYHADVAVTGDQIVELGPLKGVAAERVIDADGRFVCPGFIDMHTHSDLQALANPLHECKTRQGVTTDLIGHDGLGLAPVTPETAGLLRDQLAGWNGLPDVDRDWQSIKQYLDRFDDKVAVNIAMQVPHGTVRMAVMGMDNRAPSDDEMRQMQAMVTQGMREGAVGLSTGLTYAPCSFAHDDELVELCKVMRPFNGFYCPHHRNYGAGAMKGFMDSIEIGRRAGVAVHLTHCNLGFEANKGRGPQLLEAIDEARAQGVEVTMDGYPYLAGNTYLHAFLPSWMHEGSSEQTLDRLANPANHDRLRHIMEVEGSDGFFGVTMGWQMLQIGGIVGEKRPEVVGLYVPDAAEQAGQSPFEFFVQLLIDTRLGVSCLAHVGNEENVQTIMQHPAYTVGSDGILIGERPHPRGWGTHVRFLAHYARDLGLMSWQEAVRKMTSAAARRIGWLDRGIIRRHMKGDLVIFDPDALRDTATYDNPRSYPVGVGFVAVNGTLVVDDGQTTGAKPGRALRRPWGRSTAR